MTVVVNPNGPGFIEVAESASPTPPSAAPQAPVRMVDQNNRLFDVPAASVEKAVKLGWRPYTPPTAEDLAIEREAKDSSAIGVGLRNFANEALFGIPEYISDQESTPAERIHNRKLREAELKEHPIAGYAGKAAGFIAPLLIPGVGEVGDAARAAVEGVGLGMKAAKAAQDISLATKIAGSAAKLAAEGAVYSMPQAAVQAAYGDVEKAAETMLWGVGLSAVLGGGGRLALEGTLAGGRAGVATVAEHLNQKQANGLTYLDDISRNILGISDQQAKKLGPERIRKVVETADREGILAVSPSKRAKAIEGLIEDSGQRIGEHQKRLEELLQNRDIRDLGPVPFQTAKRFQEELLQRFPELMSETHASQLSFASRIEKDILAGGTEPSFEKLNQIRKTISSAKKNFLGDSVDSQIIRLADKVIQQDLETAAQRIYHEGHLAEHFADYLNQKARYSAGLTLLENFNPFKATGRLPTSLGSLGLSTELIALAGHPLGAAANLAWQSFTKNQGGLLGKTVSWLRKVASDPETAPLVGGLMAKEGHNAFLSHLDAIPDILSGNKVVARSIAALNPVQHLIGDTNGLSKDTQYARLTATIQQATIDTASTAETVGHIASPFTTNNIQLGSMVVDKKIQAINYLASMIPKGPAPKPFQRDAWKPTDAQKEEFLNRVRVVNDPMTVFANYQAGTLTKSDRDTLQAVYPRLYQEMVSRIMAAAFDPRTPALSHQQRLQLSMFTGQPLDGSLRNLASIQQALASQPMQQQGSPRPSSRPHFSRSPSLQTESERKARR